MGGLEINQQTLSELVRCIYFCFCSYIADISHKKAHTNEGN